MEVPSQLLSLWILPSLALLFTVIHALGISSLLLGCRRRQCYRLPPGPRPLPVVGNLFALGNQPHRSFAGLAKTYGPILSFRIGGITTVVVTSPDTAREVLRKQDLAFSSARWVPDAVRAIRHHETSLAWLPVSTPWKNLRQICHTQLFASKRLDGSRALRREKARDLVGYIRDRCLSREPVYIGRAAFTTALNLISNTLFSTDAVDPRSESGQVFRDLMWEIMELIGSPSLSDLFPWLRGLDVQGRRRRMSSLMRRLHDSFDQLIVQRSLQSSATATNDFMDFISQDDGSKLNRGAINSLLTDLFVGGSDTSSNTVEWAMAELIRNPRSLARARAELIGSSIGGGDDGDDLDERVIAGLPYLQAVVKETFRLHPPVPFLLPRRVEAEVELCGYTVPPGTRLLVNVWAMGRDGNVWEEPDSFLPERFLGSGADYRGHDFELIPFGAGCRTCPGLALASRMVPLMLGAFLRSFEWKLPEEEACGGVDMTEKFGITVAKAVPLRAIPVIMGTSADPL